MPVAALRPETGFSRGQIGYDAILQKHQVPARFHTDLVSFMQTGKASDEFIRYVNTTPSCQEAVEEVLAEHMKNLRPLLQAFSSPCQTESVAAAPTQAATRTAAAAAASAACVE